MSDAPNKITQMLIALVASVQDAEDAWQQLLTERAIDTAIGVQLDQIGGIVGQPRNGLLDEDYRRYCRARVSANRSSGVTEQIIKIAKLIVNAISALHRVETQGIAAYMLRVENTSLPESVANALIGFLVDASSGGDRAILESCSQPPTTWQRFDLDTFDDATKHMITARDAPLP